MSVRSNTLHANSKAPSRHNFNAGPSVLPQEVFNEAAQGILNFNNSGLSILEIGHRAAEFTAVIEEARLLVRELLILDDDQEVLFLHGGASTQFLQVPMNILGNKEIAAFADTGVWSSKAIKEAKIFGKVEVVCSSKEKNYNFIPTDFAIPNDCKYLHITSNNTIYGTQWQQLPTSSNLLVADMSSDIFSRVVNNKSIDLIYAGAQKNLGAAGATLVVVRKSILGKLKRQIPTMMDYQRHIEEKSMLNTPPVFAIYVCLLNLRWLKANGGVAAMEKRNIEKAKMLYAEIDRNPLFKGTAEVASRSKMNVCFVMHEPEKEKAFLSYAEKAGIYGIAGHRSVGGFRASLYNALTIDSVKFLVDTMQSFSKIK